MTKSFNSSKFNSSTFNQGNLYCTSSDSFPWNQVNYVTGGTVLQWRARSYTEESSLILLNKNYNYISGDAIYKWNQTHFIEDSLISKWNLVSYLESLSVFNWGERSYLTNLRFNQERYNSSSFDRGTIYTPSISSSIKWNSRMFIDEISDILKWRSRSYTDTDSKFNWINRVFVDNSSVFKWKSRMFLEGSLKANWKLAEFLIASDILKWNNRTYIDTSSIFKWRNREYTTEGTLKLNWVNVYGEFFPLVDYLSVVTIQGEYLFPEIIGGQISIKEGSISEATLEVRSFIPEDSRCTFYLKGSVRMFDGNCRRCVETSKGIYKLTIQEYVEILKPESDKGGLYLVKNNWHDIELHNLLSSNKPVDNDNEIGLLYMASSAIPWHFFKEYDVTNNIFSFTYTGTAYSITEVYEDVTLLTPQTSVTPLLTASGWYHDEVNKVLYVRCTDQVFPYFHVISVPYIWDFKVPIRIGSIKDLSSTVILYWETANGDVPLTTIKNLLTALNLEMETSIRSGICYVDVSYKIGSGTSAAPARVYAEGENITKINEIDMADARNMVSGVLFSGYGQGAGAVAAGAHINMGRGGRFILLDDASVHSAASADGYVTKYLDDHFLPSRRIKFTVPVEAGSDVVDQRRLGDYTHISLPSKNIEQDLRVQEILLKLKPLSMDLTIGDKLITYDQQMKAMRDASEKFRKHLEDEIEEFSWNWSSENLDNGCNRSDSFTITADALKIQKLEMTVTTSLFKADAVLGAGGGSSGGGGGGGAGDGGSETPGEKPKTGPGSAHTHTLTSGSVGVPSGTVSVATSAHTHPISLTSAGPNSTTSVVATIGTLDSSTDCCTGINCGKRFVTSVSQTAPSYYSVATSVHTHTVTGDTTGPNSLTGVATDAHTHTINALVLADESAHVHEISSDGYNPTLATSVTEVPIDPSTGEPESGDWRDGYLVNSGVIYTAVQAPSIGHSPADPAMYFSVFLSGPGITGEQEIVGSPFLIHVEDSFGPILIDDIVKEAGTFAVKVKLANKDYPADRTHINFSMQISGAIFVDTIIKE